VDRDFKGHKVL
jgi:hypothetical protein